MTLTIGICINNYNFKLYHKVAIAKVINTSDGKYIDGVTMGYIVTLEFLDIDIGQVVTKPATYTFKHKLKGLRNGDMVTIGYRTKKIFGKTSYEIKILSRNI